MTGCTDAVLQAVRRELQLRREQLDLSSDVVEVTVTVKLQAGTTWVRGTVYEEQRAFRSSAEQRAHERRTS